MVGLALARRHLSVLAIMFVYRWDVLGLYQYNDRAVDKV